YVVQGRKVDSGSVGPCPARTLHSTLESAMALDRLDRSLTADIADLEQQGRAKAAERITSGYIPATGHRGPRYALEGRPGEFLRMNSNSYLSLSHHPALLHAADEAARVFGTGPGAVRFIDGTSTHHTALEGRIA